MSFAAVFSALAAGQTRMLLPSGAYFSLDLPELHQLRALIDEARALQDNKDAPLQISRFQAGLWDELAQLGIVDEQAAAWREAVGGLLRAASTGLPLPAALNAELRPYQLEGFNWLSFLYRHGLGGVLADDMGLGKTVQALALICAAKEHAASAADAEEATARSDPETATDGGAPFLVVAPTSVVGNWEAETARFAPGPHGPRHRRDLRQERRWIPPRPWPARTSSSPPTRCSGSTTRPTPRRRWAGLVLDEAQFVKNHQSKAYQCARKLPAAVQAGHHRHPAGEQPDGVLGADLHRGAGAVSRAPSGSPSTTRSRWRRTATRGSWTSSAVGSVR